MAYFRSNYKAEEPIMMETNVWECKGESCNGWMRQNFSFHDDPNCPMCGEGMERNTRELEVVVNHSQEGTLK